jgi:hypothetical protein
MPNFKPKTSKNIVIDKKKSITLYGKHKEFLNEFDKNESIIPKIKKEINELKNNLEFENLIENKLDMIDKIKELKQTTKSMKEKKINYFLDNSKYIFEYYENKKNISKDTKNNPKSKLIHNFFKINQEESVLCDQKNIVQKYLNNVDDSFLDFSQFIRSSDVCMYCHKGELIILEDEGLMICNHCSKNIMYLIENEKPSYKEPPKEVTFYAYKKINHFKEILAQFQGKETTQIKNEVIENIKLQIKKERLTLDQLNHYKTKEILKKLGYNKYYEHIAFIKNKLDIKSPIMSNELEDKLCNLFMEIQAPYAKYCPDYRVNFLNYYYVLYKLCELLKEKSYLEYIPMLKDREKLIEQDEIWKKMCSCLNWEFISTI